jgi:hypothetical protein
MARCFTRVATIVSAVLTGSLSGILAGDVDQGSRSGADWANREPATLVASISKISEAIAKETDRVFEPETIRRSPTLKTLAATHNVTLWNELIFKPGDDLVLPIVGLMCIEQERPELAFNAAARCVILSPRPGNALMGYAAKIITKGSKERNDTDRIARMVESGVGSDDALAVLLAALRRDDLVACFDALDVDQCAASRLAWVIGAIGAKSPDRIEEKIQPKFRTALALLADSPGFSRCTYLSLVDRETENVKECLRLAILDPDVKEMYLISPLRRFGREFAKDIEAWLPSAAEKRQTFVRKYLSR